MAQFLRNTVLSQLLEQSSDLQSFSGNQQSLASAGAQYLIILDWRFDRLARVQRDVRQQSKELTMNFGRIAEQENHPFLFT